MKIEALNKLAKKQGFKRGDELLSLGGFKATDILDYCYYDAESEFAAIVLRRGKEKRLTVRKQPEETLGLEFSDELEIKHCRNNCVFCFVSQLPKGMRRSVYVKDDDYRLSFISGSYITLTNLSEEDIARIIRLKLSPLYISVHAFDTKTRVYMLKNKATTSLFEIMRRFAEAGIKMHTQVVVCENLNDGEILRETVEELYKLYPAVESLALVPVGLTKFRDGLAEVKPITKENAGKIIAMAEEFAAARPNFLWCADEMYMIAGRRLPDYDRYGSFPQIENGVGMVRDFEKKFEESLSNLTPSDKRVNAVLVTGKSFEARLKEAAAAILKKLGSTSKLEVIGVTNSFFGETVTVAGLVTAGDIIRELKGRSADFAVVPRCMLKEFGDVFLDDVGLKELENELGMPVRVAAADGSDLIETLLDSRVRTGFECNTERPRKN
jgi:putative radical SAM enzyme (TIGR03279 family)